MKITEEIRLAHEKLSDLSISFLEFANKYPESLIRSNYNSLTGLDLKSGPTYLQPWPTFIDQRMKRRLEEAAVNVFNLIKSIPGRFFGCDAEMISKYFEVPESTIRKQLAGVVDGQCPMNLLGRGDFIYSPSGLKCLEFNATSTLGGWETVFLEPVYLNIPVISKFFSEHDIKTCNRNLFSILFERILDAAVPRFCSGNFDNEINVAIVTPGYKEGLDDTREAEEYLNRLYRKTLSIKGGNMRGDLLFCGFSHLDTVDDYIFYKGKTIHVLIERHLGDVPGDIMGVFSAGNILLYNGPISRLLSNKLCLALLSENEDSDVFSKEERETIKNYIPWTRKIVPGYTSFKGEWKKLEDIIFSERENLVIKPAEGLGGEDVYIGCNTSAAIWKEMVKIASVRKKWLVQEYVESFSYLYQAGEVGCAEHNAVWGIYVFDSQYAGTFLRILLVKNSTDVINSRRGAEETPVFEVEE